MKRATLQALTDAIRGYLADHQRTEAIVAESAMQEGSVECHCDLCEQGRAALELVPWIGERP